MIGIFGEADSIQDSIMDDDDAQAVSEHGE
jgi:hypothetical protein